MKYKMVRGDISNTKGYMYRGVARQKAVEVVVDLSEDKATIHKCETALFERKGKRFR